MNQQTARQEVPEEELSDEELFAQEADRRSGAEAEPEPAPEPVAEPAAADDTTIAPMPVAVEDDPLPEPPVAQEPADKQQVVEEAKPEWYAALDDKAKAAFDSMNDDLTEVRGQYTALHGRLAPMQVANERLRTQVEHAGQRPPAPIPNSSATSGQQPGQQQPATTPTPTLDLGEVPEFAEFREAFPEEAKAIAALFGRQARHASDLQTQLGTVSQGLQEIQQASFGQKREDGLNKLAAAHPDWMQVRPSEHFAHWLATQPRSVSRMADSQDAGECIYVLDRYKQDVWAQRQIAEPAPAAEPAPSPTQTVRENRRQRRSAPSLEPQGSDVGRPQGGGEYQTDEEIWDEEVERRLRQQRDNR